MSLVLILIVVFWGVGDVIFMVTILVDVEVEVYFLVKEDGVVAGIVFVEMIFYEVDFFLKVLIFYFF